MLESLSPTKQTSVRREASMYRYYAGYPAAFVESLIAQLEIGSDDVVLDPWNGAGTTTSVCAAKGISSIGIDANPFMNIVAAVRGGNLDDLLNKAARLERYLSTADLSSDIVTPEAAATSIVCKAEEADAVGRDEIVTSFILGSAVRSVYRAIRSSNPTWFSVRKSKTVVSSELDVQAFALAEAQRLVSWTKKELKKGSGRVAPVLLTGDAATTWIGRRVDHIITSPPYLTRIDYVQKTLPELLFLRELYGLDLDHLRQVMLGTVLTGRAGAGKGRPSMPTAKAAAEAIDSHSSKASKTYYLKFYLDYFDRLPKILDRVTRHLKADGTVTLVTQGSYYKEFFVDLPKITIEAMQNLGFEEVGRQGFRSSNHMAAINSGTFASKQAAPEEVVSTFRRNEG